MRLVEKPGRWIVLEEDGKKLFTSWAEAQEYIKKISFKEEEPIEFREDDLDYGDLK